MSMSSVLVEREGHIFSFLKYIAVLFLKSDTDAVIWTILSCIHHEQLSIPYSTISLSSHKTSTTHNLVDWNVNTFKNSVYTFLQLEIVIILSKPQGEGLQSCMWLQNNRLPTPELEKPPGGTR